MNLVNAKYSISLAIEDGCMNELVIENPESFASVIEQLLFACDGNESDWILSENEKSLRMDKICDLIMNPLQVDFNNKKIQSKLYQEMVETANEYILEKNEINKLIINQLAMVIDRLPYECVSYNLDFDWNNILKSYNVQIDVECNTLTERLLEYIKLQSFLMKTKVLFFVNLRSYITIDSVYEIQKMAAYYKMAIILIENIEREKISHTNLSIIDNDNCLILK